MTSGLPQLDYYLINAFETGEPGSGDQVSVVLFPTATDPRADDDDFLRSTTRQFWHGVTAFLVPLAPEEGRWGLRWHKTYGEVPMPGLATLAAARVILSLYKHIDQVILETLFWGELVAKRCEGQEVDQYRTAIEISLEPLSTSELESISETSSTVTKELRMPLAQTLGIKADQIVSVGRHEFVEKSLLIELSPEVDLAWIKMDPQALLPHSPGLTIITQMMPHESSPGTLRTNARLCLTGYVEDYITPLAQSFLASYYLLSSAFLRIPQHIVDGREIRDIKIDARQLSTRGGKLEMRLAPNGMVRVTGVAVEWARGTLSA